MVFLTILNHVLLSYNQDTGAVVKNIKRLWVALGRQDALHNCFNL